MLLHLLNVITAYRPNKLSKKIKKETKQKHDAIEKHPLLVELVNGTLPDYKYGIYLINLLPIYTSVETFFLNNTSNTDLIQSEKIRKDLHSYSKYLNVNFNNANVLFYSDWISHFFSKDQFFKKTELYVRWLADMYGGQILKKKVRFGEKYEFKDLRDSIKTIRKEIEDGLNEQNVDQFIDEVNKTYDFHYKLADKVYGCPESLIR